MLNRSIMTIGILVAMSQAAAAQRIRPGFLTQQPGLYGRVNLFPEPQPAAAAGRAPDHRWEGLIVGAVLIGAGGALLANGFCDYGGTQEPNCFGRTVVGGVIGATVGAVAGGLIGGLIPKRVPAQAAGP